MVFMNDVIAQGAEVNQVVETTSSSTINTDYQHKFIIDAPVKFYNDIKKIEQIVNFKFKVPDYLPQENKVGGFQVRKLSEKDNALEIFFENTDGSYSFVISERDPVEILEKIENEKIKAIDNSKVVSQKEPMKFGDIKGLKVTLTTELPDIRESNDYSIESRKNSEYFSWKDGQLWYSVEYNSSSENEESSNRLVNISQDDIVKIAKSLRYIDETKNVSYLINKEASIENPTLNIYDKEDLDQAKSLLGFNPKFPLNINQDIKITSSIVGVSGDSDTKNSGLDYQINNFYSNKNGSITFTEQKKSKIYEEIEKNSAAEGDGNTELGKLQIGKIEKLNINNNEVYKYVGKGLVSEVNYIWKENNIYNSVTLFVNVENSDDIAKEFVNSKPLE
jgi:bla regulator protein BlaR1